MASQGLIQDEKDRIREANKEKRERDVLLVNFRTDIFALARDRFEKIGISKEKLEKWQEKYPFLYPWNTQYEVYRINVNRKFVVYPLIIAMCCSERDVRKSLSITRKYQISLSIRGGSHCVEPYSLTEGILIDQSRRIDIKIDLEGNRVTVEPGVLLGPLIIALNEVGYAVPSGTCPNVGIAGLSLGGGIGFLARKYGATCDSLHSANLLLANKEMITVDHHKLDLQFALRGAGIGNFGIVTSLTFNIYPIKRVVVYSFQFPYDQLIPSLDEWQNWAPSTDINMGSEYRFNNGGSNPTLGGLFLGSKKKAKHLIERFLRFRPISVMLKKVSYADAAREFAGTGRWLPFTKVKNGFVNKPFPHKALEIIAKYMKLGSGKSIFELNALGGKFNEVHPNATAFVHRDSLFWFLLNAHWSDDLSGPSELEWVTRFHEEMRSYLNGQVYQNMPDSTLPNAVESYYGSNLHRLKEIKRKYDPENLFSYAQSIPLK